MAQVIIAIDKLPKTVNYRQMVEDLGKLHPGAEIDLSNIEGRTVTPRDSKGNELEPVYYPGTLTVSVPDGTNTLDIVDYVSNVQHEKTDKEEAELKKAEDLLDTLLKSPRFKALMDSKITPVSPKVEEVTPISPELEEITA